MTKLDGVLTGRSHVSLPDTKALQLTARAANGPDAAYMVGREFAHLHGEPDGSLHLMLPKATVEQAIAKGWAEPHPLVRSGLATETTVMPYSPRDQDELELVWSLVQMSHAFARGDRPCSNHSARSAPRP
jgi:hypothetical protein